QEEERTRARTRQRDAAEDDYQRQQQERTHLWSEQREREYQHERERWNRERQQFARERQQWQQREQALLSQRAADAAASSATTDGTPAKTREAFTALYLLPSAPARLVTIAWRELAKTAHPDRGGATRQMQDLNAARDMALTWAEGHKRGA